VASEVGSWLVEGIGEDFIPPVCDLSRVREALTVDDAEAFETCRMLLRREGIFAGTSTGTLVAAALRYCRAQREPQRVVTFVCDSGNKYLSKVYNDYWMMDQGFVQREAFGDLRDLIARRHLDHAVVTLSSDDTLLTAYSRMKLYDVSQLPVMDQDTVVGILDEEDILLNVFGDEQQFQRKVGTAMSRKLSKVSPGAPIACLIPIFDRGMVAIVEDDGGHFLGLITRIDMLNYLRRRMS
ncbi:MAG: pyridoxal-phosphate dependent enzyme, partial [Gammaproteobacteria bacterium]|nr:pyridoxal-phosphate dependent enzyme [Gammaproteobacteria bacterium]